MTVAQREQTSLTEQLAEYWSKARYEDLPESVVVATKRVLLDTLAGISAHDLSQVPIGRELKRLGVRPSRGIGERT